MTSFSPDFPGSPRLGGVASSAGDLLRSAVDLFALAPAHERAEIRAFADLLAGLLPDAGPDARAHAAETLAHRADTPPVIARMLAMDAPQIARPLVLRSPVLTSGDLVQIMKRGPEHVDLVAERLDLTPEVARALGRMGENDGAGMLAAAIASRPEAAPAFAIDAEDDFEVTTDLEEIVADANRQRPLLDAEAESEVALQRALDALAAELEAEAGAVEAEAEAARALRAAAPAVAGDVDAFLDRDPAGRWRYIQDFATTASLSQTPRRRKSDDPAVIGAKFFGALVAGERERLTEDLMAAARLDRPVVERILTDRLGEALAVTLAALGIDERTATSILLLHTGKSATLAHMQDLSAMAGRIGWRTAEQILMAWRGEAVRSRSETMRLLDPADRRGAASRESAGETSRTTEDLGRRSADRG